jgi:hypothetical protein
LNPRETCTPNGFRDRRMTNRLSRGVWRAGERRGHNGHARRSFGFARVRSDARVACKSALSANGCERVRTLRTLAMQEVVGSSPIIRLFSRSNIPAKSTDFHEVERRRRVSFSQVAPRVSSPQPSAFISKSSPVEAQMNEPSTPSLPCAPIGNRSQPMATISACFRRSRGCPICHWLPPVATALLHKCFLRWPISPATWAPARP